MQDLAEKVKQLQIMHREACNDLENERKSRRDWQNIAKLRDDDLFVMRQASVWLHTFVSPLNTDCY